MNTSHRLSYWVLDSLSLCPNDDLRFLHLSSNLLCLFPPIFSVSDLTAGVAEKKYPPEGNLLSCY